MKKKLFLTALLAGLLMATPAMAEDNAYESGTPITIHIDGEYLPCDVDPVMVGGRTLMPVRAAGEALGATVWWDGANQAATLTKGDKTVMFFVDSTTGEPAALPTLPAGDMTNEAMRWVQKYYTPEQNGILGGWKHGSNLYGASSP